MWEKVEVRNIHYIKMSLYRNISAFSQNGEYLAYSSPDGCLKIWETSTSVLRQEFTPSSHLSATCTSISWGPAKLRSHLPKSPKKSKNSITSNIGNLQLIAMGTMTGDVLLYSFTNAELYSLLTNGHTGAVNDICWHHATNSLFTCSNDQHIIGWDISSGKIKTKWKADKVTVHSICVIDDNHILSASSTIQLWDIKQKNVINNFEGHSAEINRMLFLCAKTGSSNRYFLSTAIGDRVINAWQLTENNTKGTVASFVSSGEPSNIDISMKNNEPFKMSVVTKDGLFHLFEHTLNGKSKKPLSPKFTIQIASKGNSSSAKPHLIPIIAANISEGVDSCLLTYGSFLKPVFERINISDVSKDVFLVRDLSSSTAISVEGSVSRVKQTERPKIVKMLAPGHMTDITLTDSTSKKRKQKDVDIRELPMEERLKALDLSKIPKSLDEQEPAIKSDSMVHLLLQGLQSKDNNMLNTVLQCGDETVIHNTLQRLPLQSILLVLKELYERLNKQESRNHPCVKWLNGLLSVHLPYLMSCKDIDEYLGPISQLIEARIENFKKMLQLRGCLKILLSQAESSASNSAEPSAQPLVEYESESSDDGEDDIDVSENNSDEEAVHETPDEESESEDSSSDMEA